MLRAAAARLPSLAARVRTPATRRSMGSGDVKRHPDLERWNNVRDNVDQIVDFSNPVSFMRAFVAVVVVPTVMYKLIVAEGLAPNGDGSTGVVLARKIKKETAEKAVGTLNEMYLAAEKELDEKKEPLAHALPSRPALPSHPP